MRRHGCAARGARMLPRGVPRDVTHYYVQDARRMR